MAPKLPASANMDGNAPRSAPANDRAPAFCSYRIPVGLDRAPDVEPPAPRCWRSRAAGRGGGGPSAGGREKEEPPRGPTERVEKEARPALQDEEEAAPRCRTRRRRSPRPQVEKEAVPVPQPSRPSWITAPKLPASMPASANMDGNAPRNAPANDRAPAFCSDRVPVGLERAPDVEPPAPRRHRERTVDVQLRDDAVGHPKSDFLAPLAGLEAGRRDAAQGRASIAPARSGLRRRSGTGGRRPRVESSLTAAAHRRVRMFLWLDHVDF